MKLPDRQLGDFLSAYREYTSGTESARIFHDWVGISLISSALRKKVKLDLGMITVFPNTYIVLVAEPGKARKSVSLSYGKPILKSIEEIKISADAITREALLQDLEACVMESPIPGQEGLYKHCSLSIISAEFESFLGQKIENAKMLVVLTDLFDCSEEPWRYRTKNSGDNTIPSVFVNILGATTPDSLAMSLPAQAIGGGFTSRVFFVWADAKEKKVPIPTLTPRVIELKPKLMKDLHTISMIGGPYILSKEGKDWWYNFYYAYEDLDVNRICTDTAFNGWYSRKPMMVVKIAMICAASESNKMTVEPHHLERALKKVEEVEMGMGNAFRSVGKSFVTSEIDTVMTIIAANRTISEHKLMRAVWRDLDDVKFVNVINTILKTGRARRVINGKGEVTYHFVSD